MRSFSGFFFFLAGLALIATGCGSPDGQYNTTDTSQYTPEELDKLNTETIDTMLAIADMVEAYIDANPEVGAPKSDDINELIADLKAADFDVSGLKTTDAFGNTLVYRHEFSNHEFNRRDYDLISYGEDGVQDLWRITDHIRDTFYGQDILWRHQSAVMDRSGFIHGPSLIRHKYPDRIAPAPESVDIEY